MEVIKYCSIFICLISALSIICVLQGVDIGMLISELIEDFDFHVYMSDYVDSNLYEIKILKATWQDRLNGYVPTRNDAGNLIATNTHQAWHVNPNHPFSDFADNLHRAIDGFEAARFLEYEYYVLGKDKITVTGTHPTFGNNQSAVDFMKEYAESKGQSLSSLRNYRPLRDELRNLK